VKKNVDNWQTITDAVVDFLVELLKIDSPTGYTTEAMDYVEQQFTALNFPGFSAWRTPKGALVMEIAGQADDAPRGVTAHVDTLGLMVRAIKPSGRLKTTRLGGIVYASVDMAGVTVRTANGQRIRGTMVLENPSSHVNIAAHTSERTAESMEVRLDIKTRSEEETRAHGIEVGDYVFLDPNVEVGEQGFIRGRFIDNKAGIATIYGALMALRDSQTPLAQTTRILIANYEEVGHGGGGGWNPDMFELLAVDMGAIGEDQQTDEFSVSICAKDGGGPYHFEMTEKMRRLAQENDIPYNMDIYINYSSDGTAYWRSGGNARVALVGPGVDCSHAYERTHRESLLATWRLIAAYLQSA
jgi:putative aminopeptidase FrvX